METESNHLFEPGELGPRERTHFWIDPRYNQLECFHARFHDYHYSPHFHETYVFGHVERGVEHCRSRGKDFALTPGSLTIINPGDLHDGRPGEGGFEYRMFYPSVTLMQSACEDMSDGAAEMPWFSESYIEDQELEARIAQLHKLLQSGGDRLEADSMMLETLAMLIKRHSDSLIQQTPIGDEIAPVQKVQDYIQSHLDQDISLDELAALVGMNRYRLIRSFRKELGLTPHAYLVNRRVQSAKEKLKSGDSLSGTAVASGFYDQAHFAKTFKKMVGVTPGQYAKACNA